MTLVERLSSFNWGGTGYGSYEGRLDRAGTSEAKTAYNNANDVAATEGSNAAAERSQLMPFYRQEMNAEHLYNPEETNELLNYAGQATGGTGAAASGEAAAQAARTRNTSGFTSALDQNARDRSKVMSTANLGVGAEDVMGAKKLNQEGAAGMSGLEGMDLKAQLEAMGQEAPDINAQVTAGKSGWFQNMNELIRTLTGGAQQAGQAYKDFNG